MRRQQARKAELARAEERQEQEAQAKRNAEGAVKQKVDRWSGGKGIVAMLQTLHQVLPGRVEPIQLSATASQGEVRKAYLKVQKAACRGGAVQCAEVAWMENVLRTRPAPAALTRGACVHAQATRSVHPDKLTSDVGVEEKMRCVHIRTTVVSQQPLAPPTPHPGPQVRADLHSDGSLTGL